MNDAEQDVKSVSPKASSRAWSRGWLASACLGACLVFIYLINGRDLGSDDAFSASLLPLYILRGEGVYLENRIPGDRGLKSPLSYFWKISHGHVVPLYPLAPGLMAIPFVAPEVAIRDLCRPGWDRDRQYAFNTSVWMAKHAMAVIVALAAIILHRLLLALGVGRAAVPAVLAAFLGSELWTVGSQAAWQHGPAALSLVAAIALLHPLPTNRWRLALSGAFTGLLVACRLMDVVFAGAIVIWLATTSPRRLLWFLPAPLLIAAALLAYNVWFFGSLIGGQVVLEQYHLRRHGVAGTWSGNLLDGLLGTLFSPNRGLLVYSPWIVVALATLAVPAVARRLASQSLICALVVALVPYTLILSKYAVWWGGHCFGPRYWTDVIPIFAIIFAFGLDWMFERSRVLVAIAALTVIFSIAVQTIGAFCYPSSWNREPSNVDRHHERLWDWRDTEISRCLHETFAPRAR
jgi:hypothetical protein